ncbi:ethanolaminephosphotransferase 1 isoform X2 [Eurytemora carolleeae]|uniref:ethanolaminephosphotransferase 1 isoform X2 n=1 Tax=Eurytemora carolleeae TaxID=1294199 RepID=UPI000C780519|nr:ethanolaminephosphotransferase 1 isoform X2 [Eurytemora carolleeae]|eukprot:XP_023343041.1 ethanolaminephosphotransferase 1-like isoform X2 [Eurytemora affinis]
MYFSKIMIILFFQKRMVGLYYEYLGPTILSGFETYKYSCKDTSPLSQYVMHPFWNQVVKLCPAWVAPNLLTLVGFICCVGHFLLLTIYDYDFTAGTAPPDISGLKDVPGGTEIPGYIWISVAILLFLSHTLDGIDGKQARRTGSSTPLGELFDHGLDSWATIFITGSLYSVFGRDLDLYSITPFRMFCIMWNVYFCFLISHWEKYNTGVLYLPWGYDLSMLISFLLYIASAIGGQMMWKIKFPGDIYPGPILQFMVYFGNLGMTLPTALYNIWKSYKEGTGKNRPFLEAMRPLVSTSLAMGFCFFWVLRSPNSIVEKDTRCVFYLTGTIFANICCKLIIAQMSSTRSELLSGILVPVGVGCLVGGLANLSENQELALLYSLTVVVTLIHLHYGVCVVREMCGHFRIHAFSITSKPAATKITDIQRNGILKQD